MGSVFFVVGPVRGETLVGLAAKQEVAFLLEDSVDLFAARLIEIGHRAAAELEALGRILGRPAGRLHDAIHGNLGADDNLPHGSLSLFEPRTNGLLPIRHIPTLKTYGDCSSAHCVAASSPPDPHAVSDHHAATGVLLALAVALVVALRANA